ncbi:MAG: proline/glycine betaine ABC transporter permease, partial [Actinomycetota bacterium]
MDGFRIPIGEWVAAAVAWVKDNLEGVLDFISFIVKFLVNGLTDVLLSTPIVVLIIIAALIAWAVRSIWMAVGTAVSFALILSMGLWVA